MQIGTPNSVSGSARKCSLSFCAVAYKTNTAEWIRFAFGNRDAEVVQSLDSVRHQSLAARLVDRWNRAIGQDYAQTTGARRNSRCQPARSAADYEYVHRIWKTTHHKFLIDSLPFQQNELRAEPGTHRGQQAERAGFRAAILHDFFEHHEHGSRRQISGPAQALPGNVELTILQAERLGGCLQNLRSAGMERPAADVGSN